MFDLAAIRYRPEKASDLDAIDIITDKAFGPGRYTRAAERVRELAAYDPALSYVADFGGEIVGSVRHPFPGTDFSSFLLQAQASGAKVIGLANAGADTVNSIKQAAEFGIVQAGQKLAGLLLFINNVHSLGTQTAQGLQMTTAFYWDMNDDTRAFSERFRAEAGAPPSMVQAGVYAGTLHYLKAVEAVGSDDAEAIVAKMKEMETEDPLFGTGYIRKDGRVIHDMYLMEVKTPDESENEWDLLKLVATIPGEEAFLPMEDGGCAFALAN